MAVPSAVTDLSITASSNSPAGSDIATINTGPDEYLRALAAIIRREQAQGANVASAATVDLGAIADGNYVHITGTTTITAFGTVAAGIERTVVFDGALTLTHNATSLILPGGANITTAAGDAAILRSEGSGNWRCVSYVKASGAALLSYQPLDALLTALAAQTVAANNVQAYSGADTPTLLSTGTASGNVPLVGTKSATETLAGLVELATQAEAEAGSDDTVVMTPLKTAQAVAALTTSVGDGQTYQNVSAFRAIGGGPYTNDAGRPIAVIVSVYSSTGFAFTATVDGVSVPLGSTSSAGEEASGSLIIPAGSTYSFAVSAGTPTLTGWVELR